MYNIAKAAFRNKNSTVASLLCSHQSRSISSKLVKPERMAEKEEDKKVTRVLFCGPHLPDSYNFTRDYLQPYPFIQADVAHFRDVPEVIKNYHICVTLLMQMDSFVISRATNMKLIMQFGVGLDGVDIDAATKHGIKVARIPSEGNGNAASCSEMAIYLMLGLLKKQNEMQMSVQSRLLGQPTGGTLLGKTVFILGYGNIGIELAKRLKPFGSRVIATKRSWPASVMNSDSSLVDEKGSHEDIYTFASKADIVVVCLRLSKETVKSTSSLMYALVCVTDMFIHWCSQAEIVNNKFISSMKKGALLVNIARGGLINYESAYQSLESGYLGGLGTDVAWSEPFDPNDPILKFKNVIMTPHVAGVTEFSYRSMAKVVGDVALQLHEGLPLTGIELVN
ncbi:hydroxypyruvate reductase isoform X2 [Brassica napus]|uniref:hydroxypyruvate reductase isoform X2 n=1 Tax=Brassica napus TaxID=3708 RepID=UPI0020789E3A|nr:hydroxypyruvate reductase isoform X2 [Brassica napus]